VPTTFVVDRDGKIVSVVYGSPPDVEERLRRALSPLLSPAVR
jgi:peroxiredoxin